MYLRSRDLAKANGKDSEVGPLGEEPDTIKENGDAPDAEGGISFDADDVPQIKKIEKQYDADALSRLEGLEAVRHRPAMYIGDTGISGLHHLFKEIIDNSIDEVLAGNTYLCEEVGHLRNLNEAPVPVGSVIRR